MATNYERGRAAEYKSKKLLENLGYSVIRSAGSHSVFDLVGYCCHSILFVQVKTGADISKDELDKIDMVKLPSFCHKFVHYWERGKRLPSITLVE